MKSSIGFLLLLISFSSYAQDSIKQKKPFVAVLTLANKYKADKNWKEKDQAIVQEHFERLVKFKNEGKVILAGRTDLETSDPDMMGLVIFYAEDNIQAKAFMAEDPAVKNKIMLVKVLPYSVAISECK